MPGFVRVVHHWTAGERWNAIICRLGRFGARTRVPPGLYALGAPGKDSPVIATGSYRLSFDLLRRDLAAISCWILVLDTRGLDVGSAVAAGRFGTDELVIRLASSRLAQVVGHRRIIFPGLAAGAVDRGQVARATGFETLAGPARSSDLPGFLAGGGIPEEHGFAAADAAALVPAELGRSLLKYPGFAFAALLFAGLGPGGVSMERAFGGSWPILVLGLASVLAGSFLGPILHAGVRQRVPLWAAGAVSGLAAAAALMAGAGLSAGMDPFLRTGCWLFFPAASAYMAEQFSAAMPAAHAVRRPGGLLIALALFVAGLTAAALVLSKALQFRGGA